MRTTTGLHALLLAALSVAAGVRPAQACSCVSSETPCGAYATADVVFVGEVLSAEKIGDEFHMRLRVVRAVKGITETTAELSSNATTSCGVRLTVGARYVIHTSRLDGRMAISACHYIQRIPEGAPEPELPPVPGRVYGHVGRYDLDRIREFKELEPIASIRLSLQLPGGPVSAVSDAWGRFQFADVPPGTHALTADAGQGLESWGPKPAVVLERGGCTTTQMVVQPSGKLSGRILTADGNPASGIYARLLPGGSDPTRLARFVDRGRTTDRDGRFTFDGLNPDTYIVAVNPEGVAMGGQPYAGVWFGGTDRASATRVPVAEGAAVELDRPFVLPAPVPTRTITVAVKCQDGSVPSALMTQAVSAGPGRFAESDENGGGPVRTLTLVRDHPYRLLVSIFIPAGSARGERREEKLAPIEVPAGAPGRHYALVAPFTGCAERPRRR